MKKNIIRMSSLLAIVGIMSSAAVVGAANWTSEVSVTTPSWGGTKYNYSTYDNKDTRDVYGSMYATYQKTSLHHAAAETYRNQAGGYSLGTAYVDLNVGSISHPAISPALMNIQFWSVAKSHNLEPTNGTVVKYKYSADNL